MCDKSVFATVPLSLSVTAFNSGFFCVSEGHVGLHQSEVQAEEKELQELGAGYSQRSQGTSQPICVHSRRSYSTGINTFDIEDV